MLPRTRLAALRSSLRRPTAPTFRSSRHLSSSRSPLLAESSSSSSSSSSQQAAQNANKAAEGIAQTAKRLGDAAAPLAQRASKATGIDFAALLDSVVYNLKVAGHVARKVYVAEGLAPPTSLGVVQESLRTLVARASDPAYWSRVASNGEWRRIALYAVEAYGIFTIGEMIGRRHVVGYKLDTTGHPDSHGHH